MKFVKRIVNGSFSLYLDNNGNVSLNIPGHTPYGSSQYNLGNWKSFKKEVEFALDEQRQSMLSSYSLDDLEKEVSERRIKIKSGI